LAYTGSPAGFGGGKGWDLGVNDRFRVELAQDFPDGPQRRGDL